MKSFLLILASSLIKGSQREDDNNTHELQCQYKEMYQIKKLDDMDQSVGEDIMEYTDKNYFTD